MVVISTQIYEDICRFCSNYKGLSINCEEDLRKNFANINEEVLSAILSKECQKNIKHRYHFLLRSGPSLLKE